jgi:hypothetical protein
LIMPAVVRPALHLDFASARLFDPRLAFTRASTARYFDAAGVLRIAPAGVARLDHDPATGAGLGLLIEEQRTNLVLQSEDFAAWGTGSASIAANSAAAPDGTETADKFVPNGVDTLHRVFQAGVSGLTGSSVYTASVFVRSAGMTKFFLRLIDSTQTDSVSALFDLAAEGFAITASGAASSAAASLQRLGNGWYRAIVTGALNNGRTVGGIIIDAANAAGSPVFAGDGMSGIWLWGAQFEAGAPASSYIPTTAAPVTRAADLCTMDAAPWFSAAEGTVFVDTRLQRIGGSNSSVLSIDAGDGSNDYINLWQWAGEGPDAYGINARHVASGVNSDSSLTAAALTVPGDIRGALSYQSQTASRGCANGGVVRAGSVAAPAFATTPGRLTIGAGNAGPGLGVVGVRHYRRVLYFPRRLSDAQLQALTA